MSEPLLKKNYIDETHIGEHAAHQPLSGVKSVERSFVVHSAGSGALRDESDRDAVKVD